MSTLRTTNLQHASAASPAIVLASSGSATAQLSSINDGPLSGMRNRIINGDMRIDQRNAGASVTITANGAQYITDRFIVRGTQASKLIAQQSSTAPSGFSNSLLVTSSSAYSVVSSDYFVVEQRVEGLNTADLAFGGASAKQVTLSFWVRSSLTGTFGGAIGNSALDRTYPFSYTISAANTWEQKAVVVTGDTTGTWLTTAGIGLSVFLALGTGSSLSGTAGAWSASTFVSATGATSVVGTNGATFYLTGVQLEPGSVATPFERRSYGQELALCQRYLPAFISTGTVASLGAAYSYTTTNASVHVKLPVTARTAPTGITVSSGSHFSFQAVSTFTTSAATFDNATTSDACVTFTVSGATAGQGGRVIFNNASGQLLFTGCEL